MFDPLPVRPRLAADPPGEIGVLLAVVLRVLAAEQAGAWLACRVAIDRIDQAAGRGCKRASYWLRRGVFYQFAERAKRCEPEPATAVYRATEDGRQAADRAHPAAVRA